MLGVIIFNSKTRNLFRHSSSSIIILTQVTVINIY